MLTISPCKHQTSRLSERLAWRQQAKHRLAVAKLGAPPQGHDVIEGDVFEGLRANEPEDGSSSWLQIMLPVLRRIEINLIPEGINGTVSSFWRWSANFETVEGQAILGSGRFESPRSPGSN